jgi:hypothetical protein
MVCGLTVSELPPLPGAGVGAGDGDGDGDGDALGDGDVPAVDPPPHCAAARADAAIMTMVSSRCIRMRAAAAEMGPP